MVCLFCVNYQEYDGKGYCEINYKAYQIRPEDAVEDYECENG